MIFDVILEKNRLLSYSEKDKGDRFERLMQAYLKTDPKYADLFRRYGFGRISLPDVTWVGVTPELI